MSTSRRLRFIQDLGFFIDQIGFPFLIAYFILEKSILVSQLYPGAFESLSRIQAHNSEIADKIIVSRFLSENMIVFYNVLSLWALSIRKKPLQKSETVAEITIPVLTIAVYISLNLLSQIPPALNQILVPERYALSLSLAGSVFVFCGLLISVIAIFHLRHSFSILVQVRDVVSQGFYRYVRHPIYLGYFIQIIGFLLAIPYLWTLLWAIVAGNLFITRARLEEKKIAAYSPEYRDYMKSTPFLNPFLKRKST